MPEGGASLARGVSKAWRGAGMELASRLELKKNLVALQQNVIIKC